MAIKYMQVSDRNKSPQARLSSSIGLANTNRRMIKEGVWGWQRLWDSDPEYYKKLKNHGHRVSYKDISMRSTWEVRFAKDLDKYSIAWVYEPKTFRGEEFRYLPDFFLPDKKLYIEIKPDYAVDAKVLRRLALVRRSGCVIKLVTESNWDTVLSELQRLVV